ncbi:MAG TPA: BON domain-containing protein [Acidimicrobiia bacterium]|nr:BON domain-containing protein [Acidimicrobiia bacterium]
MGVSSILKRYLPLSGSAIALWAWRNRDDVIDWAAFGVRSAQSLVSGNTDDVATEARLRIALHGDRRTRRAPGLEVLVRDHVAVLKGIVDPEVRDVAVKLAERTEGVEKVDDRMDEVRRRLDPPRD